MAFINIPANSSPSFKDPVADFASLPSLGNATADVRVTIDTLSIYIWDGASWQLATGGGGGGLTSLNGLTASSQTFATGTSGSDFNINSTTSTHTFNIPDASGSARGVITTGVQTIAGNKTFSGTMTLGTQTVNDKLYHVEKFILDNTDISNGYVTLTYTPTTASNTILTVIGGTEQIYPTDFTVSTNQVSWTGLALDGVLVSGDIITIKYN